MNKYVIITAGGVGKRMGGITPKQFLEIDGKPILQYTIERFKEALSDIEIIITLPIDHIQTWKKICEKQGYNTDYEIAVGGKERFNSVKNGLNFTGKEGVIGIHDGVRPFVSVETIRKCYEKAEATGAAIPVLPIHESIRQVTPSGSKHVNRDEFRIVQTPQCFVANIIKDAYKQDFDPSFTDDASVVEKMGVKISLVNGNPENIKITEKTDIEKSAQFTF